jgi:hypothetical protein
MTRGNLAPKLSSNPPAQCDRPAMMTVKGRKAAPVSAAGQAAALIVRVVARWTRRDVGD